MHDIGWGWALLITIAWLAILGLLVGVVLTAVRDRRRPSPRETLDRRLATGEIGIDEYERARAGCRARGPAARRPGHRRRREIADLK
jgi:uncharacterized membrane protein